MKKAKLTFFELKERHSKMPYYYYIITKNGKTISFNPYIKFFDSIPFNSLFFLRLLIDYNSYDLFLQMDMKSVHIK